MYFVATAILLTHYTIMKEDYNHFNADDFLRDSYFLAWMRDESPEINVFWERWKEDHPDKIPVISEAIDQYRLLVSFNPVNQPSSTEREAVWQAIETGIGNYNRKNKRNMRRIVLLKWSAVAAVALLFWVGWFMYKRAHVDGNDFVIVQADSSQKRIVLNDSSVVVLNAYTVLKYRSANCRELWLKGQAFFDVKHRRSAGNSARPFTIHAGAEDIDVLGTVFTVKTIQNVARVVLLNGKVKASVRSKTTILKPGDKVEWENGKFSTKKVNPQLYMAWKDGEFHFEHTSLKELADLIKDLYGYDLIVKNRSLLRMASLSGTISSKDEETLWKTIAVMFNVNVEKRGKQVVLTPH